MITSMDKRPLVPSQLVLGMVIFILGAVFLADSAGMLSAESAISLWPIGLVALGLIVVLQPDDANRLVGAVLIIAGVWLLLDNIGLWSYSFWRTWPYLLMIFGAWMLYRVRRMREWEGESRVAGFAFLNSLTRQAASTQFEAGEFSAVAGECDIDLGNVTIADGNAETVIDTFALFGRMTLRVPAGWRVDNRILPLLGRVDTTAAPSGAIGPTIVVQGSAICSKVSVAAAR
jgi:predicted membrane protein